MVYASDAKSVANIITDAEQVSIYKEFCEKRNSALRDCKDGNIVVRSEAVGCGCGLCIDDPCEVAERFVAYADGDVKKCRRITCSYDEVRATADPTGATTDALVGLVRAVTYINYKRTEVTEDNVDIKYCIGDADDETTTTTTEEPAGIYECT